MSRDIRILTTARDVSVLTASVEIAVRNWLHHFPQLVSKDRFTLCDCEIEFFRLVIYGARCEYFCRNYQYLIVLCSMEFSLMYVQFVMIYSLFKMYVAEATSIL